MCSGESRYAFLFPQHVPVPAVSANHSCTRKHDGKRAGISVANPHTERFPRRFRPMKLYVDMMSQPSRAVCLFCDLNDISYEKVMVRLGKHEQATPEFKGSWYCVPSLEHSLI